MLRSQKTSGYLRVASQSRPELINHRISLVLRPSLTETWYSVHSGWADFGTGTAGRTRLARTVGLRGVPDGRGWHLALRTQDSRLTKASSTPFDDIAQRLTGLYAELLLEAAPTGELLGLLNAPDIRQHWARIRQELLDHHPAAGELLAGLVADVDRQLAQPEGVWPSLPYNYFYAALLGSFYQQPFEANSRYARPRVFPQFFDGLDLHFTETLRLAPDQDDPAQALLLLHGVLDPQATAVAAVAERIRVALGSPVPVEPEEVLVAYHATHCLLKSTGLPVAVELTVSCTYRDLYHKEYYLTIDAQ